MVVFCSSISSANKNFLTVALFCLAKSNNAALLMELFYKTKQALMRLNQNKITYIFVFQTSWLRSMLPMFISMIYFLPGLWQIQDR